MGNKLSTASPDMKKTPLVNVRGEKKSYFIGKLLGVRSVKSAFKNDDGSDKMQNVYEFSVIDTDMEISGDAAEGSAVGLFAPTRLNNALRQASIGQSLRITYMGLGKATKRGGKPHEYEVEVI